MLICTIHLVPVISIRSMLSFSLSPCLLSPPSSPSPSSASQLTPTLALYDTIRSIKSPVGTLALGYAYNNAGFLLAAGEKVGGFLEGSDREALHRRDS